MRNNSSLFVLISLFGLAYSENFTEENHWVRGLQEKGFIKEQEITSNKGEAEEAMAASQKNTICKEDVEWLKQQLKEINAKPIDIGFLKSNPLEKCKNCFGNFSQILEEPHFKIFISFSVPESIWCSLSKDLVKLGGTFVLIGLPNNSFSELSEKIFKLKSRGVDAQIQIDPMAFKKYEVAQVPTFVVSEGEKYDKVSGTISVEYALHELSEKGEIHDSKSLKNKLRDSFHD